MKKKLIPLIVLAVLTVIGSLFTMLASNMLMDDLFNKGVVFAKCTLFVSLPAVSVALLFLLGVLYIIRTQRHPDCKRSILRLYLTIEMAFALIGLVGAILGGTVVYGTFLGTHPFKGYLIIFMILNILILLAGAAGMYCVYKHMPKDEGKVKINFVYVLKTIGWVLFIGMVFNRFGTLLGMPVYVYTRNLYYTFPTYLYLLVPLYLGVVIVLYNFEIIDRKKTFLMGIIGAGASVLFFAYTTVKGLTDTAYISSISQLYPIDRMASMPIEYLIQFLSFLGVAAAIMVIARPQKEKKEEKEELAE